MSKNMKYSEVRQIVYSRYNEKCAICGHRIALDEMCINLITPKSKGGCKDFANMQSTCESCCKMKHDLTNKEFFRKALCLVARNWKTAIKAYVKGGVR